MFQLNRISFFACVPFFFAACGEPVAPSSPSDDPADWVVDTSVEYEVTVSEPQWVVPSPGLPDDVKVRASNNNVDIEFFQGRLYMGWRTGKTHFADDDVEMVVVSSDDMGKTWRHETTIKMGNDVREPRFLQWDGKLQMMYFEAGVDFLLFEPQKIWQTVRDNDGTWGEPEVIIDAVEVPWDVKTRYGETYMTTYTGGHYGEGDLYVHFKTTTDGKTWEFYNGTEAVYTGGVSEVAFEFDMDGNMWAVTRNEDGDHTGLGSHVCFAAAGSLDVWECPEVCDPERYDSPEMFRHGKEIYMVARRDIGGPYGDEGGDMVPYSTRPKRSALYWIDQANRSVVHMYDIPGVGDTAFPSIRRIDEHRFLMANYTSPLDQPDLMWVEGQSSADGTQLYLAEIVFTPVEN